MQLHVTVTLRGQQDEPDIVAADALEKLAIKLREAAPHDFITSGAETLDARAHSEWTHGPQRETS